jgi:hypothetical protein
LAFVPAAEAAAGTAAATGASSAAASSTTASRAATGAQKAKASRAARGADPVAAADDVGAAAAKQPATQQPDSNWESWSLKRSPDWAKAPKPIEDGAFVALMVVLWCWVALPMLVGGKARLRAVLMAKFLNRKPDGSWLP